MDFYSQMQLQAALNQDEEKEPDVPYERTFFERLFAPIQAPQEFLFGLTTNIADEGFQFQDIWDASTHAARYFNPWSNEKPVDVNDVREVFFGDSATGFLKTAENFAISMLFDPLLVTGGLKAVGMSGRALNVAGKVLNPAEAAVDAMRVASTKVLGPLGRTAAYKVFGKERAEQWGRSLMQGLLRKHSGVTESLLQEAGARDAQIHQWLDDTFRVIDKASHLGDGSAQRLLTEALEAEEVFLKRTGRELTKDQARKFDTLAKKIEQAGIDKTLFWESYDNFRKIDDEIGMFLVDSGVLNAKQFEAMRGTHLRRIYQAYDNPLQYAKRVEDLNIPDVTKLHKKTLYDNLNKFREDLGSAMHSPTVDQTGMFSFEQMFDIPESASRYFEGNGRFHVKNFVDDLDDWLIQNPSKTVDEVMDHVNNVMLKGVNIPPEFNMNIGQYMDGTIFTQKGSKHFADMLRSWARQPNYSFRVFNERLKVVSERSGISEEIRQALGEILEAGPRLVSETSEAGTLAANRMFQSKVAGQARLTYNDIDTLRKAKAAGERGAGFEMLENLAKKKRDEGFENVTVEDLIDNIEDLIESGPGTAVGRKGSGWASVSENAAMGHTYRLPDTAGYGDLASMYVKPTDANVLRHMVGVREAVDEVDQIVQKHLNILQKWTSRFKTAKAVLDPVAQVRNFIGNAALMAMAGVSPLRVGLLRSAAKEIRHYAKTGEMGEMLKLADEAGVYIFQNTWSKAELGDLARRLASIPEHKDDWKNVYEAAVGVFNRVDKGASQISSRMFDFQEKMFKLSVFTDRYKNLERQWVKTGKPLTDEMRKNFAKQAGALAERALFNYSDVPYYIDLVRKYGIIPFATFPFKAVPFVAEVMYEAPHRILRFPRAVEAWNEGMAGNSAELAQEIEALPEHVRNQLVLKMPFKDRNGRPLYLDLSYFMPWGVLKGIIETLTPSEGTGGSAGGMRSGILTPPAVELLDAFRYGIDGLGNAIVKDGRSAAQNFRAMGNYLWQFIAPPSFPGGSRADSIGRAMQAVARSSPERVNWLEFLGRFNRGFSPEAEENVFNQGGFVSQSQAQVGISDNPWAALTGAAIGQGVGGILLASDTDQAAFQTVASANYDRTQAYQTIADIQGNRNMSIREKNKRIQNILDDLERNSRLTSDRLNRL